MRCSKCATEILRGRNSAEDVDPSPFQSAHRQLLHASRPLPERTGKREKANGF
jgi:hypothetical protein